MFLHALTVPSHVVNAITLEAYKKWILVSLINSGGLLKAVGPRIPALGAGKQAGRRPSCLSLPGATCLASCLPAKRFLSLGQTEDWLPQPLHALPANGHPPQHQQLLPRGVPSSAQGARGCCPSSCRPSSPAQASKRLRNTWSLPSSTPLQVLESCRPWQTKHETSCRRQVFVSHFWSTYSPEYFLLRAGNTAAVW